MEFASFCALSCSTEQGDFGQGGGFGLRSDSYYQNFETNSLSKIIERGIHTLI